MHKCIWLVVLGSLLWVTGCADMRLAHCGSVPSVSSVNAVSDAEKREADERRHLELTVSRSDYDFAHDVACRSSGSWQVGPTLTDEQTAFSLHLGNVAK